MSIHIRFQTCTAILIVGALLTPVEAFAFPLTRAAAIEVSASDLVDKVG